MNPTRLLQELVEAIDAYDKTTPSRQECEFGASPELLRYWEAQDRAKEYINKVNSTSDDLAGS